MNRFLDWRSHLVYWILPTLVVGGLVAMYFSGNPLLMEILAPQVNRELGLLENLQNIALLASLAVVSWRVARSHGASQRLFFGLIAAGCVFMLLEELDYGTHYWWALNGWDMSTRPVFNVHNQGDNSDKFKNTGDFLMVVLFVLLPFLGLRIRNRWIRYLRPSRMFVLSVLAAVLLSDLAHYLEEVAPPEPNYLDASIGEYRELFTYYIWLLYFGTLALKREWPAAQAADTA